MKLCSACAAASREVHLCQELCACIKCFRMSVRVERGCVNDIPSGQEQCWGAPQGQERTDLVLIFSEQPPWGKLSSRVSWEKE